MIDLSKLNSGPILVGRIPEFIVCRARKRGKISFEDVSFEIFDVTKVYEKQSRDWNFFLKIRQYSFLNHFVHSKEPFSHVYEKQYWSFTFFVKFCYLFRAKFSPLNSSPFSASGDCSFFEFETLNSPQRCTSYVAVSRDLSFKNLKRFSRAMEVFMSDFHDEFSGDDEFVHDSILKISKFVFSGKKGDVRFVSKDISKDEIPDTNMDRHAWPDLYIDRDVKVKK